MSNVTNKNTLFKKIYEYVKCKPLSYEAIYKQF